MSLTLYGIKNCDTVKKAREWLDGRSIPYAFHDYKSAGVDEARLRNWVRAAGWERLLNRQGTTFRKLADEAKADLNAEKAIALMLAQPSMIKRPVAEGGAELLIGFDPARYEAVLLQGTAPARAESLSA